MNVFLHQMRPSEESQCGSNRLHTNWFVEQWYRSVCVMRVVLQLKKQQQLQQEILLQHFQQQRQQLAEQHEQQLRHHLKVTSQIL